jgi:hypothetical protein
MFNGKTRAENAAVPGYNVAGHTYVPVGTTFIILYFIYHILYQVLFSLTHGHYILTLVTLISVYFYQLLVILLYQFTCCIFLDAFGFNIMVLLSFTHCIFWM